jgi:lysophospholipase L1-like esterase
MKTLSSILKILGILGILIPTIVHAQTCPDGALTLGNNARVKVAIEKARAGETVTLAYIGGSVTNGGNANPQSQTYAVKSFEAFKSKYGTGNNVQIERVGIDGTDSELGVVRYNLHFLERGMTPDIVVIEYALNDGSPGPAQDLKATYESLVRKALNGPGEPAVVLMFGTAKSWGAEGNMRPTGDYYNLPMVSMEKAGAKTMNGFFSSDNTHPTNEGHALMADCLSLLFSKMDAADSDASQAVPANPMNNNGASYENMLFFDKNNIPDGVEVNAGPFTGTNNGTQSANFDQGQSQGTFTGNWHTTNGGEFNLKIKTKNLVLAFLEGSNVNNAQATVDGKQQTVEKSSNNGGWTHSFTRTLFNNAEAAEHEVSIRANGTFTILGFGYTPEKMPEPSSSSSEPASSSSSASDPTPVFAGPVQSLNPGNPDSDIFDIHGNRVHGTPSTPGVYVVRTGAQTRVQVFY